MLSLTLPEWAIDELNRPGPCDDSVADLLRQPDMRAQLDEIPTEAIRAALKPYGAWDDTELADEEANRGRIVWIAAGQIAENRREDEASGEPLSLTAVFG